MHLYLMRHGTAEPSVGRDAARSLTDRGRTEVQAVAAALERAGYRPGAIIHSPLVRSRQSAELIAAWFGGLPCVELSEVVAGGNSLLQLMGSLELENPLVVGRAPSIPRLATDLAQLPQGLMFHCASLAAFLVNGLPPDGPGQLLFHLDPHLLGPA